MTATGALEPRVPAPSTGQPRAHALDAARRASPRTSAARRFAICMLGGVVLAVMTGPPGTNAAPTSGFTGSLQFPRLFWFLGFGAVLFAAVSIWKSSGRTARTPRAGRLASVDRPGHRPATDATGSRRRASSRSASSGSRGSRRATPGRVASASRSALRSRPWSWSSTSSSPGRCGSQGWWRTPFLALYGVLAWMHNSVSRYLNTIGAVPHDRTLGPGLLLARRSS